MTAILGAGIAGLSAAYYALESPRLGSLVMLEASNRVGGWIRSIKQSDGVIFEKGPRTMRGSTYNTLDLVQELGLSDKVIPIKRDHPAVRHRYIYADNELHHLIIPPPKLQMFTKNKLLNRYVCGILWKELCTKRIQKNEESIYDFIKRRFGKEVTEKLVAPIICGIYAGNIHELSAKSCMKSLFEAEQNHGSILRGFLYNSLIDNIEKKKSKKYVVNKLIESSKLSVIAKLEKWSMWGIEGGFEQLPIALAENITKRGVNMKMQHNCEKIMFHKDHVELIINGKSEKYSRIISSLPAKSLAVLVEEQHPELSKELYNIPAVTVGVVNLQFSNNVSLINAFGLLIPPKEEIPVLGITFDSIIVPQNSNMTVLTVMMGGAWFEKFFGKCPSEEHLKTVAIEYTNKILGIHEDPKAFNVSILRDCIPQYTIGHTKRLTCIREYLVEHKIPLTLCGSSYEGVGVGDVILSAKQAVSHMNLYTI